VGNDVTVDALTAAVVVTGVGLCITNALADEPTSGGVPKRVCLLVPGNIAWDACDCDGQLALTIQRIYPTRTFPTDASNEQLTGGCLGRPLAVQALASLVRCVPSLRAGSTSGVVIPSCDALYDAALRQQGDAFALRRGVECCLDDMKRYQRLIFDFRVGGTSFVGPEGGCGGVELPFTFQLL